MESATTATKIRASYRPRPAQGKSSTLATHTGKRGRAKSRLFDYFEDPSSEGENPTEREGDGSSSGESISSNDRARTKRRRTSRTTRSSTRPTPILSTPNSPADALEMIDLPGGDGSHADPEISPAEVGGEVEAIPTAITETTTSTAEPEPVAGSSPAADPPATTTIAPPPVPGPINAEKVPVFLLSHSKGSRRVNIFDYLNKLQDPHFQQVLFHYVHFEINCGSDAGRSLPITGRPVEISWWTSRARPAHLPGYTESGRTFRMFVDSVFDWWSSIQPSWRSFERGVVSREIQGDWEVLCAPRINGLLNVVILVYWWSRILEEDEPEDGVRTDYEFFADDVAWVFSHLST